MGKLAFVSSRQETVQNGRNLALEDEFAIDKSDLLGGHLGLSKTSAILGTVWGRAEMSVSFLVVQILLIGDC